MSSDLTNASLLLLDTNGSNATSISIPEQTTGTNISGHQILSQVQQELNFLPSTNDNVLVMGNIQMPNGDQVQNVHTAAIMTGTMESNVNKDSDLLISSKSFDLSSTTISLDSPDGGTQSSKNPKYSIWQSEFYAQYFDITTEIFCRRVLWSLLPLTGGNKGSSVGFNNDFLSKILFLKAHTWNDIFNLVLTFTVLFGYRSHSPSPLRSVRM